MKEKRLMHGKIIDARRSQQKHSSARPHEQGSCSKQDVIDEDVDVQYHTNIFTFHFHFTLFISSSTVPEDSAELKRYNPSLSKQITALIVGVDNPLQIFIIDSKYLTHHSWCSGYS